MTTQNRPKIERYFFFNHDGVLCLLCLQLDEEIVEAEYRYDDLDDRRTEVTLGILFLVLTIFNEGGLFDI